MNTDQHNEPYSDNLGTLRNCQEKYTAQTEGNSGSFTSILAPVISEV